MPIYNVSSTSAALGIPRKWLDNLLSHNKIDGVDQARQGIQRRLSIEAVAVVGITYHLVKETNIPIGSAVALAERLIWSPGHSVTVGGMVTLTVDKARVEGSILHELEQAVETTPVPARGRPVASKDGADVGGESEQGAL